MEPQTRYDCFLSKDGKRLYYINGKRVAKEKIPRDIVQTLVCKRRDEQSESAYTPIPQEIKAKDYFLSMPYELQKETMRYVPYEDILTLSEKPSQLERVLRDPEYWAQRAQMPKEVFTKGGNPRYQYLQTLGPDPIQNAIREGDIEALKHFISQTRKGKLDISWIIDMACKSGTLSVIQYLRDTYPKYFSGGFCSTLASINGRDDVLEYLDQFGYVRPEHWRGLISYAILTNNPDLFFDFVERFQITDHEFQSTMMISAILVGNVDILDYVMNFEDSTVDPEEVLQLATTFNVPNVIEYIVDNYDLY